ncbi:MAG: helix-turn-helix transcriptional regulator [Symploca sp. SIO2E9]|nr:helix-turn-helix transcriptional regulator [Symploca sp. SIO2E9]
MNFSQAFDSTLKNFGVSAKWLAERSGVAPQTISDFRRGKKSIQTDSLGKLLVALPVEAQVYFFNLLLGRCITPEQMVEFMDSDQLSSMLLAIAKVLGRYRDTGENSRTSLNAS